MTKFKKIALFLVIVLVGIQFIPIKYNLNKEVLATDFLEANDVPLAVANTIKTSCYDCHSNNTSYPWYSKIQPMGMLMQDHIEDGKEELNFSEFDTYSKRKKRSKLKSIINQIKDDEMPLSSYLLMHSDAKLNEQTRKELVDYFNKVLENL